MFLSFVDDKKRYKGAKVGGTLHLHLALRLVVPWTTCRERCLKKLTDDEKRRDPTEK